MTRSIAFSSHIFGFSVVHARSHFPFVQTHTFQMEPYLKNTQGYALFVVSSEFDGTEIIKVRTPNDVVFPDTQKSERTLSQFSNGMWFISDNERTASAMGGPLPNGVYEYSISNVKGTQTIAFPHSNFFLQLAKDIQIADMGNKFLFSWKAAPEADTFWVFVFPSATNNILNDLKSVSSVMHQPTWYSLIKSDLKSGTYKVAIRAIGFGKVAHSGLWIQKPGR